MGSFISMPSIKTRVCSDLAPRINTEVCPPGPPDRTTSRAGTVRRTSRTVVFCLSSICWLVMTVIELPTSLDGVSILVAVTTTSSIFSSFALFSLLSDCFVVSGASVSSDSWAATTLGTTNSNASNTVAIMHSLFIFFSFPPSRNVVKDSGFVQVSWLTFILLTAPSHAASGGTVACLRLSSRSQSRGGERFALPSLRTKPAKSFRILPAFTSFLR
ncbi:hypothetical protein ES703_22795 [subsurface metagenome]